MLDEWIFFFLLGLSTGLLVEHWIVVRFHVLGNTFEFTRARWNRNKFFLAHGVGKGKKHAHAHSN